MKHAMSFIGIVLTLLALLTSSSAWAQKKKAKRAGPQTPKKIVIAPDEKKKTKLSFFELKQDQNQKDRIWLSFVNKDKTRFLDLNQTLVIQIFASEPLRVEPSLILRKQWPKGQNRLALSLKGQMPKKEIGYLIGEAAFKMCKNSTRKIKNRKKARQGCQTETDQFRINLS